MNTEANNRQGRTDWLLLFFLFLFVNQANLSFKILGLIFIFLIRPDFGFGFKEKRIPAFYIIMPLYSLFVWLFITREFSANYLAAFVFGNLYWVFGLLAFHQLRLSLEKYGVEGIDSTFRVFTVLNVFFSIYQLVRIMAITGTINPYANLDFPYGMSTGDNISGFFLSNSYYNMMISAMLVVYFVFKRRIVYSLLATLSLVLVFGNIGTVVFVSILGALLLVGILNVITGQKLSWINNVAPKGNFILYIPLIVAFLSLFYVFLSPENMRYLVRKIEDKVFALGNEDKNNYRTMINDQKIDPAAYDFFDLKPMKEPQSEQFSTAVIATLNGSSIERKKQITLEQINLLKGKSLSIVETSEFLKSSPKAFLFGAGTGRFSSLTAQKFAGYDSSRLFLNVLPRYTSRLYEENHKLIIDARYKSESTYFSNANWPDSFYNFIFGEYGVLGVLLFMVTYVWYFLKDIRYMSYTIWMAIMMVPFANLTYLFEALSIIPLLELLIIADIQRGKEAAQVESKQHV